MLSVIYITRNQTEVYWERIKSASLLLIFSHKLIYISQKALFRELGFRKMHIKPQNSLNHLFCPQFIHKKQLFSFWLCTSANTDLLLYTRSSYREFMGIISSNDVLDLHTKHMPTGSFTFWDQIGPNMYI